jgi:hypothetical protein
MTDKTKEPSGTCQGCLQRQQTRDGKLVLHGYQRPGTGYIIGECWGYRFAPWEISCERTKDFVKNGLKPALANNIKHLAVLEARPETLSYLGEVTLGYNREAWAYEKGTFLTDVARDAPASKFETVHKIMKDENIHVPPYGVRPAGSPAIGKVPSYEDLLANNIAQTNSTISQLRGAIAEYERRIAAWKPVPWPVAQVTVKPENYTGAHVMKTRATPNHGPTNIKCECGFKISAYGYFLVTITINAHMKAMGSTEIIHRTRMAGEGDARFFECTCGAKGEPMPTNDVSWASEAHLKTVREAKGAQ